MKLKTIMTITLAATLTVGVTSCEDILKVDSKSVVYDYENTLDQATDTVYSVLGILKKLQKIADRTVILGEIRGDLVALSEHASDDLRELYSYDFGNVKGTNKYDQPVDYYAVINNCNFFLTHADTAYVRNNRNVFLKEYITVLSYRAWAYLQLAQIYGEVLYFDKPISGDNAKDGIKMNIKELAQTLLLDFKEEYMDYDTPNYGKLGGEDTGEGGKSEQHESVDLFIPVRIIMGDLCLWAEDYAHAAIYYHDFLSNNANSYTVGTNCTTWQTYDFSRVGRDSYTSLFAKSGAICYIPMEADQYSGIVTDLPNVFNSTEENYYWYQLTRSQAAGAISARQNYCYHAMYSDEMRDVWPAYMADKTAEENVLLKGDLRMYSILETDYEYYDEDDANSALYSNEIQTLNKINSEKVWLYRKDVVYLRLAEALNRCGLPQTAFAILKEGLCKQTIDSISQGEKDRAKNINGVDISVVYDFPTSYFTQARNSWSWETVETGYTTSRVYVFSFGSGNTIGIHSRGCGDASYDPKYKIPVDSTRVNSLEDSIRAVEEALIDEMALETCFEGYRFGDLMRFAMHRAADVQSPGHGGFAENEFLAKRVATRETATVDDREDYYQVKDETLYTKLLGDGRSFNKNWFLALPDEKQVVE